MTRRSISTLPGKIVAPGFIDVHTHDDGALLSEDGMDPKISQGVTTVIAGNCGISLAPLLLDMTTTAALHAGRRTGEFSLRPFCRLCRGTQAARHRHERGLAGRPHDLAPAVHAGDRPCGQRSRNGGDAGSSGAGDGRGRFRPQHRSRLSAGGRRPRPLRSRRWPRTAAALGGPYVTHTRNYFETMDEAIEEAIDIADDAGGKLVISHHQCNRARQFRQEPAVAGADRRAREDDGHRHGCLSLCRELDRAAAGALRYGLKILITWSDPHPGNGEARVERYRARMELHRTRRRPNGCCRPAPSISSSTRTMCATSSRIRAP